MRRYFVSYDSILRRQVFDGLSYGQERHHPYGRVQAPAHLLQVWGLLVLAGGCHSQGQHAHMLREGVADLREF